MSNTSYVALLGEVRESVRDFYPRFGLQLTPKIAMQNLMEEIGEYFRAVGVCMFAPSDGSRFQVGKEAADVIYTLVGHVESLGFAEECIELMRQAPRLFNSLLDHAPSQQAAVPILLSDYLRSVGVYEHSPFPENKEYAQATAMTLIAALITYVRERCVDDPWRCVKDVVIANNMKTPEDYEVISRGPKVRRKGKA